MPIRNRSRWPLPACALCCAPAVSAAEPLGLTDASTMDIDSMVPAAKGCPNEEHRLYGLKAYVQDRYSDAYERFRYQDYLGLMRRHGMGRAPDRVQDVRHPPDR